MKDARSVSPVTIVNRLPEALCDSMPSAIQMGRGIPVGPVAERKHPTGPLTGLKTARLRLARGRTAALVLFLS
jgi:hypothetical protein